MPTYHHNNSLNQDQAEPAWNKERMHAKMQRERRLLETGEMDDRPPGAKWPFKFIGGLLVIIAIGLAVFGVTQFIKLRASGEWHHINTTVTATNIVQQTNSNKKITYDVYGIYTYTVKAHTFQFSAFEDSYNDLNTAQANAPRYIGRRTDVYYNPISPGQVASFPVMTVSVVISLTVALVLLLLSSFFWARGLERSPKIPARLKPAVPDKPDAAGVVNP
jgi:hypothetical protein